MEIIPVFKPLLTQAEMDAAQKALELGWLGMGAYVGEFEKQIQQFIETQDRHVVVVSTGHAALHLGLILAAVGMGDEVITPAFNNIADFQAILAVGAQPVFCDIDPNTLCIDLNKAEMLISPKTKAMIVMDYDCVLCDHDQVKRFAGKNHLRVIHDAAHSFGSRYQGQMIGSFSDICMFSFDPVKTITCIDGGALVVKTEAEVKVLQEMRLMGMGQPASVMYQNRRAWTYDVNRLGFRYHMANLHAAIGLAQLSQMDRISTTRREACRYYNAQLSSISQVIIPKSDFNEITPFLYYIRVPEKDREALRSYLSEFGIDTGIHWQPGHWFTLFQHCRCGDLTVTNQVGKEILSLPLHSMMTRQTQDRIIASIRSYFDTKTI